MRTLKIKLLFCFISFCLFFFSSVSLRADPVCCIVPDNGTGTADLPPLGCSYGNPDQRKMIINGLPPGTTIEITETLGQFFNIVRMPGGILGGEIQQFSAMDEMQMNGTGLLASYKRPILIQVQCETHTGPRHPGTPVQSFDTDMFRLQGQLPPGDPDFDLLRITAGTGFGMPSPGHTTLTRLPDGNWNVDSFFDITYQIDFVGAPGGPLSGMSGSTTGTIHMMTGCTAAGGGQDCYNVTCGISHQDFNSTPIPAGFFDPGSDPFDGLILFNGGNPAGTDVVVRRLRDAILPGPGSTDIIPIELVALNLVSCQPITITYNGGQNPESWNVSVGFVQPPPPTGQMAITKTYPNGGTFTSVLYVQPLLTFTKLSDPSIVRLLDIGPLNLSTSQPYRWQDTSPKPNPPCNGNGFYPTDDMIWDDILTPGTSIQWYLEPPKAATPYVAIDTKSQWNESLQTGTVASVDPLEWNDYMGQWSAHLQYGQPYPQNQYFQPELYVWEPNEVCSTNPSWPDSAGLVMAWHDDMTPPGSYSAAWKYTYPTDPDLSNVFITVTVLPPCANINTVSLGLKDINGNIRAWHWNVPGTLPCGVPTTITIDTSIAGPGAGSPPADGYMSNPAFDITQVAALLFDENCQWVAGTGVPPPGQTIPRAWNYWYDLIITPKPVKTIGPLKWSQPPVELDQGRILGWDEKSIRILRPLMADDWLCKDQRPVTDIHWWGSFIGWMKPELPPQKPSGFHFGIWTDVPKNPNDLKSFSHPGRLIWQHICYDYQWNFAGYDKDPRKIADTATGTVTVFDPAVKDSCFQFYCVLPQASWFYQKPQANGQGSIYWLSIAAIYPSGTNPYYPWGWKTRPRFFNDDAVRIFQLQGGIWPPVLGSQWASGRPVEFPRGVSWDLAFELTTNTATAPPIVDYNADGIVNFWDLAFFANYWLETIP